MTPMTHRRLAALLLAVALATAPACDKALKTNVSPVADVANAGGKIEDAAHVVLTTARQAQGQGQISRAALDQVALAVNQVGHLGADLAAALDAYNAVKAAGGDLTLQRAAVQQVLGAVSSAMADVGQAIPSGTLQAVDAAVSSILSIVTQVKGVVGL